MTPNGDINTFVDCVYERGDIVEWRALGNGRTKNDWVLAEELERQVEILLAYNIQGYNIYVGANPRTGKGQKGDDYVATFRTVFVDFDHLDVGEGCSADELALSRIEEAGLPMPTMRIFSGHGIHAWWRLRYPIKVDDWVQVQKRMIATLDTDKVIKNPERIMRLPGFDNCKSEPRMPCFVIEADKHRLCSVTDMLDHCKKLDEGQSQETAPAVRPVAQRPKDMEVKARAMLYAAKWPAIKEGDGRDNQAYHNSCILTNDFELSDGDALEILRSWNATNIPPLPDDELVTAFGNAKKYKNKSPGTKLQEPPKRRAYASADEPPPYEDEPEIVPKACTAAAAGLKTVLDDTISGKRRTVEWPWPLLGEYTEALLDGTVTTVCGAKGATKTFLMLQSMAHWIDCGERVAMLVMEEDSQHCLRRCLAQKSGHAGITRSRWVKDHPEEAMAAWQNNREVLDKIGAHLFDLPEADIGLPQVARWIKERIEDKYRIIIVDPITAAVQTSDPWIQDAKFVNGVKRIAREGHVSIILTTHPKKGGSSMIDLDSLAGSAALVRFSQTILWLEAYDEEKEITIKTCLGNFHQMANRMIHILAARNATGRGKRIAYVFSSETLTFQEVGIFVKETKNG